MASNHLGRHIVVEFYNCDKEICNDVSFIEESMIAAARNADATIINSTFHHFSPFGVSGVVVIQESHLAIHTWPEYGHASIDIYTCGETVDPWICYRYLHDALKAEYGSAIELGRGQIQLLKKPENQPDYYEAGTGLKSEPVVSRNIWFTERNDDIALSLRHTGEMLYKKQSPFQKVEVFDTYAYGKMLTLDGKVMTTERDEYVYHEMITHVPLLTHPNPKRVLVIGGGDGGAVREILRHDSIEEVVLVEIDPLVLEACRIHLPNIASHLDHPKLKLLVEDGIKYVNEAPDSAFDLVIVDSTDPIGPAEGLFTAAFYKQVSRILTPEGVMITQSESPRFNADVFQEIYACYRDIYGADKVHAYLISVPTYPSGTWSLAYCAKGDLHPVKNYDLARAKAFTDKHKLHYYNAELHAAAFVLPNYVKELLKG